MKTYESVDEYMEDVPSDEARRTLARLREIIREEAPEAQELISYGMPGYKLNGYLIGFAAFKKHCSIFPGGRVAVFAEDLEDYKTAKGTIQFPSGQLPPEDLIRRIIRHCIQDNRGRSV